MNGLGDVIAWATTRLGIKPCPACTSRQEYLNSLFPFKNRRINKDGSISFVRRGKMPEVPPGYERDPNDPYRLIIVFEPCEHRGEGWWKSPCCGEKKETVCKRYSRFTDRLNCANCKLHQGDQ